MYYNVRDSKGRFTKKGNKVGAAKRACCNDTVSKLNTKELKACFEEAAKRLKDMELPKEDLNNGNAEEFYNQMANFFRTAAFGLKLAKELDKREVPFETPKAWADTCCEEEEEKPLYNKRKKKCKKYNEKTAPFFVILRGSFVVLAIIWCNCRLRRR